MKLTKAKAKIRAARSVATRQRRERLLLQGQRMSNWLYNMSQSTAVPESIREDMKRVCDEWDAIKRGSE